MSTQQFFPCVPAYMDWNSWNGNLIMYFPEEPIPYATEDSWQGVAKSVSQLPTFSSYPVPDPSLYANWQSWANEFTLIINGPSR